MLFRMAARIFVGGTVFVLVWLAASPAHSQGRPSLEFLTEELCNKAVRDGDSYRPRVCEPQCGCGFGPLDTAHYQQNVVCQETQPGTFEVSGEGVVIGTCNDLFTIEPACIYQTACVTNADCSQGYTCGLIAPEIYSCNGGPCNTDADCPVNGSSSKSLTGVVPVTDSSPVTCIPDSGLNPSTTISSVDANECLEQILAVNALDCGFRCGNGLLDAGEGCDDGNETPGDGCDASCQVE